MTTYEQKIAAIKVILYEATTDEQVAMHNEACEISNYDERIYSIDDFDDLFCDTKPYDIASMCYYGDFLPNCRYFKFNGYGNPTSSDYPDGWMDFEQIAECCVDNDVDLNNDEIRELLDQWEEEAEDEEEEE